MNVLPFAMRQTFGHSPERGADVLTGALACYGYYQTSDGGWIAMGALEPQFWKRFCELIGRSDLVTQRLSTTDDTKENLKAIFLSKSRAEWVELLGDADCCVSPVLSFQEAVEQQQTSKDDLITIEDPIDGAIVQPLNRITADQRHPFKPAPRHGEHTSEILKDVGITGSAYSLLVQTGVIPKPHQPPEADL